MSPNLGFFSKLFPTEDKNKTSANLKLQDKIENDYYGVLCLFEGEQDLPLDIDNDLWSVRESVKLNIGLHSDKREELIGLLSSEIQPHPQ